MSSSSAVGGTDEGCNCGSIRVCRGVLVILAAMSAHAQVPIRIDRGAGMRNRARLFGQYSNVAPKQEAVQNINLGSTVRTLQFGVEPAPCTVDN